MKDRFARWLASLDPRLRRPLVFVLGGALLVAGLAMLALPGPGIVTILIALALLATEFRWAERWLLHARRQAAKAVDKLGRFGGRNEW